MSLGQPKIVLPPTPPPIPPPPIAGEDTVRGVGVPKKKSARKNPLLIGDVPTAAPAVGSSPAGVFGGTPGGLAIP